MTVRLWSDKPVNILNDFTILSGLLVNMRSICILEEFVRLVGPQTTCVGSNLSVICLRFFLEG